MKIEVLISCMFQADMSIIQKSNVQSDVVVVNQCDVNHIYHDTFINKKGEICNIKFISTTERGLSKSRNMAIRHATADICLICDDDEYLDDGYVDTITNTYLSYADDVLLFKLNHPTRHFKDYSYRVGFLKAGKVGSWQISFKRSTLINNNILFNEKMGSGTGNGAGEENKFVMDCIKQKLKIRYVPQLIGTLLPNGESQWFHGYTERYWINRGWQSKMIYGKVWGYIYIWYNLIKPQDDNINSLWNKMKWLHKGYISNR